MPLLQISHVTTYRYSQPVSFGEHRLMVRPRESYDQRLLEASLTISPLPARVRWLQDVFGNAVAVASFDSRGAELRFENLVSLAHEPADPHDILIEDYAKTYPFTYSSEDMPDLLRSIERQHLDPLRQVDAWARRFLGKGGAGSTDTLAMLAAMTKAVQSEFEYVPRPEKGTQTPLETLASRRGTCRDFAMLMIEAVRALGLAARFCSGYLYSRRLDDGHGGGHNGNWPHPRRRGGGNTHAWVRVYLPGSGWIEFDPTNGTVGSRGLVRVAVARDIYQAVPISGTWKGARGAFLDMDVSVEVRPLPPAPPPPADQPRAFAPALGRRESTARASC
jgi:transglutaminase-like putative cysteine protease